MRSSRSWKPAASRSRATRRKWASCSRACFEPCWRRPTLLKPAVSWRHAAKLNGSLLALGRLRAGEPGSLRAPFLLPANLTTRPDVDILLTADFWAALGAIILANVL